VTFDSMDKKSR